ncbi:MAG: hypothetical protein FWG88_09145 [Oscillospiraceae bacterium]|nr:hypothetical protein [Oscillospiraceae bacterium]
MDKMPVLKAKFTFPEIPQDAIYFDRLKRLGISEPKTVIITAPAGYGKTTAVQLSLQHLREQTHWYRLEKEDSALPVFFTHLIEALFPETDENTDSHRSARSIDNILEEYSLLSAIICQDAWTMYASGNQSRYLVLDDFHNVSENPAISETVRYLILNMPPQIHIIIISRTDTGIIAEKRRLSGELVYFGEKELLCSQEDTEALFLQLGNIVVNKNTAETIFNYTEGWIAGITLMKHMAGSVDTTRGASSGISSGVSSDTMGNLPREDFESIFRYLLDEVFSIAEGEMVLQAARISILEEFINDDLSDIFHIENPQEIIDWLENNNFHLQKINTTPPSYRFHTLFRDTLRHFLSEKYDKEQIAAIHIAAAEVFDKTGRYKAAIVHYLSADDIENAVRIAALRGIEHMDNGDVEAAAMLMRAMPENIVFENAKLLCILGGSLCGIETDKGFSYLEKSIDMAVKSNDLVFAIKVQGFAISVCIQQNNFQSIQGIIEKVPMGKALRVSKQARKMLVHSLFLKTATSYQVKMAKILRKIIDKVSMDDQVELWQYSTLLSKAYLLGVIGDLEEAEQTARLLMEHPVALRNDRWRAFGLQLSAYLAIFLGDAQLLYQTADAMSSLGLKYSDGFASSYGTHYTALGKYLQRDLDGAIIAIEEAERLFVENGNHSMAINADIIRMAWEAEANIDGAYGEMMSKQLAPLESLSGNSSFLSVSNTLTGARYIHEGQLSKGEALLMDAWKWSKSKDATQSLCGIAMHLSELYHLKNEMANAKKYLSFFGENSEKNNYFYYREMSFPALVRCCARCVENKIATTHMVAIIAHYFGKNAADDFLKDAMAASKDPDAFIARYPVQIEPAVKLVKVKLLGSFTFDLDGEQKSADVFKTRKIAGIFKYIVSKSEQSLSREKLASIFWPDSQEKAAANSLRVALFELRKSMAALDMAFDSSNALIGEDKSGFFLCRPDSVELDVTLFTTLFHKLRSNDYEKEDEIKILSEIVSLYDGDYLEEVDSEEVTLFRAYYKAIFVEVSFKLAEHYNKLGDIAIAEEHMLKHLSIDPLDEKICTMLIELYRNSNRDREADTLKRQFTRRFKREMGIDPEL